MALPSIDEKFQQAERLQAADAHVWALDILGQLDQALPNSPRLMGMRAKSLAGMGLADDAQRISENLAARVREARQDAEALRDMLAE